MRCELHFDKIVHFVWNAVDVSIIIIVHAHSLCENAYSDFSELLFQGIFTF